MEVDGDKPNRHKFKSYPTGYFHIDIAEVRTEQGKLHLFVAINPTSKFAFIELHRKATTRVSGDFLHYLIERVRLRKGRDRSSNNQAETPVDQPTARSSG